LRSIGIVILLGLSSCGAPAKDANTAAIADLQKRVTALEKASGASKFPDTNKRYELIAPGFGSERRIYPSEAKCDEARGQILNDAANRAASIEGVNAPRRIFTIPPLISCVPA
jgi:hypothetical protein